MDCLMKNIDTYSSESRGGPIKNNNSEPSIDKKATSVTASHGLTFIERKMFEKELQELDEKRYNSYNKNREY